MPIKTFIDLIFIFSLFSLIPRLAFWSPIWGIGGFALLILAERGYHSYEKSHRQKKRQDYFLLAAEEFSRTGDYEKIKQIFAEGPFECLFCLYQVLGTQGYQDLKGEKFSCDKFQIQDEIIQSLGLFFKNSQSLFHEVSEAEFMGQFLHFHNQGK